MVSAAAWRARVAGEVIDHCRPGMIRSAGLPRSAHLPGVTYLEQSHLVSGPRTPELRSTSKRLRTSPLVRGSHNWPK